MFGDNPSGTNRCCSDGRGHGEVYHIPPTEGIGAAEGGVAVRGGAEKGSSECIGILSRDAE